MSLSERRRHMPQQLVIVDRPVLPDTTTPPPPSPGMQQAPFLRRAVVLPWTLRQVRLDIQSGLSVDAVAANPAISTSTVRTMIKMMAYDARLVVRTHQFRPECG